MGVEHNSHLFHSPFGSKTILLQREGQRRRDSLWNQLILSRSKRLVRYRNLSRYFFQVEISERGLKTPSLPCGVLDNIECQINHSLAVNWLDRRKRNFHSKKGYA